MGPLLLLLLLLQPALPSRGVRERMALATSAFRQYMTAFIDHYGKRAGEGVDIREYLKKEPEDNEGEEYSEDEEGLLEYYDIGTSEEQVPNVNWTMLTPK
jgi:hypothetical protein